MGFKLLLLNILWPGLYRQQSYNHQAQWTNTYYSHIHHWPILVQTRRMWSQEEMEVLLGQVLPIHAPKKKKNYKNFNKYLTTSKPKNKSSLQNALKGSMYASVGHILCQCPVSQALRSCRTPKQSLGSWYSVGLDLVWWSWSVEAPSQPWERSWHGEDPDMCCSESWSQTDESREQRRGIALGVCFRSIRVSLKPLESPEMLHHERHSQPPQKLCEEYLTDEEKKYYENTFLLR